MKSSTSSPRRVRAASHGEAVARGSPVLVDLFHSEPERAKRYRMVFGATHAFLPERDGIRPNTLHLILHLATLTTLIVLGTLTGRQW